MPRKGAGHCVCGQAAYVVTGATEAAVLVCCTHCGRSRRTRSLGVRRRLLPSEIKALKEKTLAGGES